MVFIIIILLLLLLLSTCLYLISGAFSQDLAGGG